jgi:hypothetical protein
MTYSTTNGAQRSINFDDFSFGGTSNAPFPVKFTDFEARLTNAGVALNWKVGTEENVKVYEVERSSNGRSLTKIGFVPASAQSAYSYPDTGPLDSIL